MLKKKDWLFLAAVLAIVIGFFLIKGEVKTSRVPHDENHQRFYPMVQAGEKKEAEKFCQECHHPDAMPLPEDHPPAFRCLFCHKLEETQ